MEGCVRRAVIAVVAVALVVALAGLAYHWWLSRPQTDFAAAVAGAPVGTERSSWTDWAGVRRELGSQVDATSSPAEVEEFLAAGYDADLTSRSALLQSASALQSGFGFSPASVEWELFSQSREGAVITLRLPEDADFAEIRQRLTQLGYTEPDSGTGVWMGGPDLVSSISTGVTPELAYLVLDEDASLVLGSDQPSFLETATRSATGDADGAQGLRAVTDALGEPLSAAVYSGEYACGALAMARADPDDQAQAAELVATAGTVDPYLAFAMGIQPDGDVRAAMEFADDQQAQANADSRAALATGPAVGQGGDFGDRFSLRAARAEGSTVTLDLRPVEGQYVLSDLTSGPVLFATC